jgi:hypothetical protein
MHVALLFEKILHNQGGFVIDLMTLNVVLQNTKDITVQFLLLCYEMEL